MSACKVEPSPPPFTKQELDDLSQRIVEASEKYGKNPELLRQEFPQFDRRINQSHIPKEP